jgi:hypothetical protein
MDEVLAENMILIDDAVGSGSSKSVLLDPTGNQTIVGDYELILSGTNTITLYPNIDASGGAAIALGSGDLYHELGEYTGLVDIAGQLQGLRVSNGSGSTIQLYLAGALGQAIFQLKSGGYTLLNYAGTLSLADEANDQIQLTVSNSQPEIDFYTAAGGSTALIFTGSANVNPIALPITNGTSGQALVTNGSNPSQLSWATVMSNPMTTLGDMIYEDATPTAVRLAGNTTAVKTFLVQTGTGTVSAAPAWGTIVIGDLPTGYPWSSLGNPTGNLSLSMGTDTTTFNHTSNVPWLWANTTAATGSTTNASPLLELAANYWTGSASAEDLWSIEASLAAGTNGASTLTFAHSGSSGAAYVSVPNLSIIGLLKDGTSSVGSGGQVLSSTGSETKWVTPSSSPNLYTEGAVAPATTNSASSTPVNMYTGFSLPGGTLTTGHSLRVKFVFKHSSGSTQTTYTLSFGGQTMTIMSNANGTDVTEYNMTILATGTATQTVISTGNTPGGGATQSIAQLMTVNLASNAAINLTQNAAGTSDVYTAYVMTCDLF